MALTATPWAPGGHEAVAGFVSQRMSLDQNSPRVQLGCAPLGSLSSSQLEDFYSAFNQGLQMPGLHACNANLQVRIAITAPQAHDLEPSDICSSVSKFQLHQTC